MTYDWAGAPWAFAPNGLADIGRHRLTVTNEPRGNVWNICCVIDDAAVSVDVPSEIMGQLAEHIRLSLENPA